jgi:GNAT superfamily N-acetyltransferase
MKIVSVETEGDGLEDTRVMFKEYSDELNENLCFQSFNDELKDPLKKYGQPNGAIFIAYHGDEPAGCIALQILSEKGVCEMKRLYVRPRYRSTGIGEKLVDVLLESAKEKGYRKMVLDTLERLQPAINLYLRKGFINTSAYYANPLQNVVYMEKEL